MKPPKEIAQEIALRPRFKIELEYPKEQALSWFAEAKEHTDAYIVHCVDDHVFIKIPKEKQHFWSPQLDIEIISFEDNHCTLHGLFGPKPSVWTLFMFIHFLVATLFIGMGIWVYTQISLGAPYAVQLTVMALLVLLWFVLYFAGRMGKATGHDEMLELYQFMKGVLRN
ncbi:GTP-binding protein [Aureisphaera galaxeae]|uniref:GTP-binding protein n=1 Tax=Aureisphaera galaxeae TaxID=1538023 RepID=UPI002350F881|nr:GTP-binding protein [Aureisphaera galaxeae]MDC8003115.1 GTP-binding protein [Aureisphaera galaxeae]